MRRSATMTSSDEDFDEDEPGAKPQSTMARELLASFYGQLQRSPSGDESETAVIDRTNFDADGYVRHLLKTQDLGPLLAHDDTLCREAKSLGSEMQMLVYENYSKFISATDTIRELRSNVGAMEHEMTALTATMAEIETMSGVVNASLADKRAQIDTLVRTRRTLKRLEFLFDVPRKLEAAIAAEAYSDALKYHRITEGVLSRYTHVYSLREIHAEAQALVARVRASLRASLDECDALPPPDALASRVDLFGALGGDRDEAAAAALRAAATSLDKRLDAALAADKKKTGKTRARQPPPPAVAAAAAAAAAPPLLKAPGRTAADRIRALGAAFVPDLVATAEALTPYVANEGAVAEVQIRLFSKYLDALDGLVDDAFFDEEDDDVNDDDGGREEEDDADAAVAARRVADALESAKEAVESATPEATRATLRRRVRAMTARVAERCFDQAFDAFRRSALTRLASSLFEEAAVANAAASDLVDHLRTKPRCVADGLAADLVEALQRAEPLRTYLVAEKRPATAAAAAAAGANSDAAFFLDATAEEEEEEEKNQDEATVFALARRAVLDRTSAVVVWVARAAEALVDAPNVAFFFSFKPMGEEDGLLRLIRESRVCAPPSMTFEGLCDAFGASDAKAAYLASMAAAEQGGADHRAETLAAVAASCAATMRRLEEACARAAIHVASCDLRACVPATVVAQSSRCLLERSLELSRGVLCRAVADSVIDDAEADDTALATCLGTLATAATRLGAALDPDDAQPQQADHRHNHHTFLPKRDRPMPRPAISSALRRKQLGGSAGIELDVERLFAEGSPASPTTTAASSGGPYFSSSATRRSQSVRPKKLDASAFTRRDAAAALMKPLARTLLDGVRLMRLDARQATRLDHVARTLHDALTQHIVDVDDLNDVDQLISELLRSIADRSLLDAGEAP